MNHQRLLTALSALALVAVARPVPVATQARQRSMLVSVVDRSGARVADLGPADFIIREDNVSREVLSVAPADEPMQLAVLVDNSESSREVIPDIRRALPDFLDILSQPTPSGRSNQVAIIGLAERPTIFANFTTERAPLDKAVGLIWDRRGGSYLLDAIIEVAQGFKKRDAARPVIVAITTDGTELSSRHYTQVLEPLAATGATLHVITLGPPSRENSDDVINRDTVVDEGPRASGGVHERLLAGTALPAKLKQLGDVLTHQYRVTYGHPDSLLPPEHVTVSVRRPDLTARGTLVQDRQARR